MLLQIFSLNIGNYMQLDILSSKIIFYFMRYKTLEIIRVSFRKLFSEKKSEPLLVFLILSTILRSKLYVTIFY